MLVKLLKVVREVPVGSIVEVDAEVGQKMVKDGEAAEYDEAVEKTEAIRKAAKEVAQKSVNVLVKKEIAMNDQVIKSAKEIEIEENLVIGKAFHGLAVRENRCKAVTGMSEGAQADGGALLGTAVAAVQGIAIQGSKIYPKVNKIKLGAGFNSAKVPIDNNSPLRGTAPVMTSPAEGDQKTSTKLQYLYPTVNLVKSVFYIPLVDELMDDVPELGAYIRAVMIGKGAEDFDRQCLMGTAATTGFVGVADATASAYASTSAVSSTPTLAELQAFVGKIAPHLRAGAEWYIANGSWAAIVAALCTAANIQLKIIDPTVGAEKLLGLPVNIASGLTAAKGVVLANFSAYTVIEPNVNNIIKQSDGPRFEYDETVIRMVARFGGTPAYALRTLADSSVVGMACAKA